MCTSTEIAAKARMKLRDFPQYFESPYTATPAYTIRLSHPNVDPASVQVWKPDGSVIDNTGGAVYAIDGRNGIIKLKDPSQFPDGLGVSGYFYEWFMPDDLLYAASIVSNQHSYNRDVAEGDYSPVECDVMATGSVSQAMWSLVAEFSTDIDVSTPEGMMIPAHQRFQQLWQMANFWTTQYKDEAAMVGVGLGRFEQFTLRRVAYLTNRLVPLIKAREVDDVRPPQRVLLPIPDGTLESDDAEVVYMPEPPSIGWGSIGTTGSP